MTTMKGGRLFAREYARVLDHLAAGEREAVQSYFRRIHDLTEQSPQFNDFLDHPAITGDVKLRSLESMTQQRFSPVVGRVLGDIIKRRMTFLFSEIAEEMERLSDKAENVHPVLVTSASPLSEPQRKTLIARLQEYCAGKVKARFKVDAALMAGFSIQSGDTILDNSIRTDLEHIRRQLMTVSST